MLLRLRLPVAGAGQTGRTTAHIMKWNDDFYHTIESKFGTPAATLVADSHKKSIEWMQRVVEKEKIDCDFQLVPGYLFGHDDDFVRRSTALLLRLFVPSMP
jgi:hypothetical protein